MMLLSYADSTDYLKLLQSCYMHVISFNVLVI